MSAYLNSFREEASRSDLLVQVERLHNEKQALKKELRLTIPRLENGGTYLAKDSADNWHYLNHASTWQGCPPPVEIGSKASMQSIMDAVHQTANNAGWHKDPKTGEDIERNFGEVVALMHSELSEALEADRKGLMDDKLPHRPGQEVELADAVIRIMDTCAARGYDLVGAIIEKNEFNRSRKDHKLENRANGGKRY